MMKSLAFVVTSLLESITHQVSASTGAVSIQQEDKMCEVCEQGGCSACEPKNNTLQFASGKEIEEFYDNYSESMYVDPAESTPDEVR
jgi:Fe-S cluster biogenesis protein NfuA